MAIMTISSYPILVELIHSDTVDHTIEDDFGITNVYVITGVHFLNRTAETWTVSVTDERGRTWDGTINPQQEGTINIPASRRPYTAPLSFSLVFERV